MYIYIYINVIDNKISFEPGPLGERGPNKRSPAQKRISTDKFSVGVVVVKDHGTSQQIVSHSPT